MINIDPLRRAETNSDHRKWKSDFDVNIQSGLRWKEWKILTGDPGGPDGHIFPPEWNQTKKLQFTAKKVNKPTFVFESETSFISSKWKKRVALFNIENDPFELEDLSDKRTDIVEIMLNKLQSYNDTAVTVQPPIFDFAANPQLHNGFWKPWILTP